MIHSRQVLAVELAARVFMIEPRGSELIIFGNSCADEGDRQTNAHLRPMLGGEGGVVYQAFTSLPSPMAMVGEGAG